MPTIIWIWSIGEQALYFLDALLESMPKIAIIGGGIAGASIAYHLSKGGSCSVDVYERGELLSETTSRSAAVFGHYGNATEVKMKRYGAELYNKFFLESDRELSFNLTGRLLCSTTKEGADALSGTDGVDADESSSGSGVPEKERLILDDPVTYIARGELKKRMATVPYLDDSEIMGCLYQPNVGFLEPIGMGREFVYRAKKHGAQFHESSEVNEIVKNGGEIEGLTVNGDFKEVDGIVCAAGPWNIPMARSIGIKLPATHTLAPILMMEVPNPMKVVPPLFQNIESGVYVIGRDNKTVYVGSYGDRGEYDPREINDKIPGELREKMLKFATKFFPILKEAKVAKEWVGIRSGVSDGVPIVGWTEVKGFSIAAFDSSGIQLSPAVGDIISKQILDGDQTELYENVSITRFEGYNDTKWSLNN